MDLSKIRRFSEQSEKLERSVIPILFLLVLVVGGIRLYPWLNTKLGAIFASPPEQNQSLSNSTNSGSIGVDTDLSPIITDRDISLHESRSQQLTELLSKLNGTPNIGIALNEEEDILIEEAVLPELPELPSVGMPKGDKIVTPFVIVEPTPNSDTNTVPGLESTDQQASDQMNTPSSNTLQTAATAPIFNDAQATENNNEPELQAPEPASNVIQTLGQEPTLEIAPTIAVPQKTASTENKPIEPEPANNQAAPEIGSADAVIKQGINENLLSWASAWEKQSVDQYFQFYTPDMSAPRYQTHEKWRTWRKARLSKPNKISIVIDEIKVVLDSADQNHATATFTQSYQADTYSDKIIKLLDLRNIDGHWLISQEKSLESLDL